jgi:GxxExxY protein
MCYRYGNEWCLLKELGSRGLGCISQRSVVINYKGFTREEPLRFDMLVEGCVLVEAKAVEKILPIHKAQLLSYMKLLDVPVGLMIRWVDGSDLLFVEPRLIGNLDVVSVRVADVGREVVGTPFGPKARFLD